MQVDSSQFRLLHSNTKLSEAYQLTSQNTIFFYFFIVHSRLNGFFTTKSVQYRAVFRGWDLRVQPPEIDEKNFLDVSFSQTFPHIGSVHGCSMYISLCKPFTVN